jgi:tetratricopeptide (TPR) repeat protein
MNLTAVFVSSTYKDLKDHRAAVIEAILGAGRFHPVGMEYFGAQPFSPKEVCAAELAKCEVYVGLIGPCRGSVAEGETRSMTMLEYDAAKARGIPMLLFVSGKDFPLTDDLRENDEAHRQQQEFRNEVKGLTTAFFTDKNALATVVVSALLKLFPQTIPAFAPDTLPTDLPDFTGRAEDVARIETVLSAAKGGVAAVTALKGMGGIGKTKLAVHVAHRMKDRYPDGRLFISLDGQNDTPVPPEEAMARVIRAYHPGAKMPETAGETEDLYRRMLAGKRALLILDNARDAVHVRPLLPPAPCGALITARIALTGLEEAVPHRLGTLARSESIALLRHASGRALTDADTDALARLCGDLPLALRVVAGHLNAAAGETVADYLGDLEHDRLGSLADEDDPDRDVERVLGHSIRHLTERDPGLAQRWRVLAVFPADFDRRAAAAVWDIDDNAARKSLTALVSRSLLECEGKGETARYRLHDLLRACAEKNPVAEIEEARERLAQHFLAILAEANNRFLRGGDDVLEGLALYDQEAISILAAAHWARSERSPEATNIAMRLPNAGTYVLSLRLHARELIVWLDAALAAARQLGERQFEGYHLGNLGLAWADLGEPRRAIGFYEQHLVIARETGDRRGEGYALGNLGIAWKNLGEPRRAIGFYEQRLVIARETGDRRSEGALLGNLGNAWADLGEPRRAIGFYEQHLAIARETGDRRGEGNALGNLGNAWADLGEPRRAIGFYEQHLAIARDIGDRRGEGYALGNLGNVWAALGEPRRAIGFHEQHLAIARDIGDRRGEGNAFGSLGNAWAALGEPRRAIGFHKQHLAIARDIGDRRGEASTSFNLGEALIKLGETTRARSCFEDALALFQAMESLHAAKAQARLDSLNRTP